ncbi:MAG: Uma2 family endonuclease [Polyangiaceae bacterium]|nr:Uma2 family endonuclease [Polyangiaceae bacterium]
MIAPAPRRHYTYDEYLAFERGSSERHEYFAGEIYAMAGGTPEHAALSANVIALLTLALRNQRCRVHSSDLRVRVLETGLATYPDATVVCGKAEFDPADANTLVNPSVLVEVTSKSTEEYDRGEKLEHYQRIASASHVVFVSHRECRVDVCSRDADGRWATTSFLAGELATLGTLGCALAVDDVYRDPLSDAPLAR